MKEMGLGGFFIFDVFTGLETRHLSAEWFVCVSARAARRRKDSA
jgi:hypothetical protein